jgi:peptide deformylase
MAITMMRAGGVGLAGNQVGIMQRIIVINTLTHGGVRLTLINPEIQEISTETEIDGEGCLSFPNQIARVKRNLKIKMRYFTTDGEEVFRSFEGFTARALQHEMDHLIGLTMVDVQE